MVLARTSYSFDAEIQSASTTLTMLGSNKHGLCLLTRLWWIYATISLSSFSSRALLEAKSKSIYFTTMALVSPIVPQPALSSMLLTNSMTTIQTTTPTKRHITLSVLDHHSQRRRIIWTRLFLWNPQPPTTPPPSDQAAFYEGVVNDQETSARTVAELEERVQCLERELAEKQTALDRQEEGHASEKTGLLAKLAEFTTLTMARNEADELNESEREQLEGEVALLQSQLPEVQSLLKTERKRAYELQEKLADLDYTLEYQQMEFDKAQAELTLQLTTEQEKLASLQKGWATKERAYQAESSSAVQELQKELSRMQESRRILQENQDQFEAEKQRLSDSLAEQTRRLVDSEEAIRNEETTSQSEKQILQKEIQQERQKLEQAEKFLKDAKTSFASMERELREQIQTEEAKVQSLTERLDQEQISFATSKESFYERLQAEEDRVQSLVEQLQAERLQATSDTRRLEDLWKEEIRLRKVKKSQMNNRFEEIRREMTALWQGALRDGRQQVATLTVKYQSQMRSLQDTVAQLETDVDVATQDNQSLRILLAEMTQQKEQAVAAQKASEVRYQTAILQKNQEIADLQSSVQQLQGQLSEREQEMHTMRTSFRRLVSETASLTARRLYTPVRFLVTKIGGSGSSASDGINASADDQNFSGGGI